MGENLTDMRLEKAFVEKINLEKPIDLEALQNLLDDFCEICRFPVAILNLDGEVLLESHWGLLCTKFHRVHPDTAAKCKESDTHFKKELVKKDKKYVVYKCGNGLFDAASAPIVIDNRHIGNFLIGQFLLEEPDEEYFKQQAQKYGFPRNEYLDALSDVPVISEEDLKKRLKYLMGFAEFIGKIGMEKSKRRDAEKSLRESEKRCRKLFQNVNEAIFIAQDGKLVVVNQMTTKITGYSTQELLDKKFTEFIHPEDREMVTERHLARLKSEDLPNKYPFRIIRRDDNLRWVELNAVLIEWEGKPASLNILNDCTERKQTEDTLIRNQYYLNKAQEIGSIGTWELNIQENILKWTDENYKIFDVPFGTEVNYEMFLNFAHPDDRDYVHEKWNSGLNGEPYDIEHRLIVDGKVKWVREKADIEFDAEGNPIMAIGFTQDITKRKQSEESVLETGEIYRNLVANMNNGVAVYKVINDGKSGSDYIIRDFNKYALRHEGLEHNDIVGKSLKEIRPAIDEYGLIDTFRNVWKSGNPEFFPANIYVDEKYTNYYENNVFRLPSGEIVAIYYDVTIRKRAEEHLKKALIELDRQRISLEQEKEYLQEEINLTYNFGEIIGKNKKLKKELKKIEQVATLDSTVLLLGETGTGKELFARAIHQFSRRKKKPLVKVNCAALPATLIESELYGHEEGAFTGATSRKIGKFELADKGTIFLDEIGDLPLDLQAKLLRVLQEKEIERIGGSNPIKLDVRVLTATNRDLDRLRAKGEFRDDLFFRLNVFPIECPSLEDRKDDIPMLVKHFLEKFNIKTGKEIKKVSSKTFEILQEYNWPGNVRELENIVERAVILSSGSELQLGDWFINTVGSSKNKTLQTLDTIQKEYVIYVLKQTDGKIEGKRGASEILGLKPSTLRSRMDKLGIKIGKNIHALS